MRPTRVLALTGLSLTLLGTANAEIESSFSAGYTSDYVFRGIDVGPNLFDLNLEFSGGGELGPLGEVDWTAGIWYGSFSTANDMGSNELDLYGELSKQLSDTFSLGVGLINLSYFGNGTSADDGVDPYVTLGAEIAGISLGATAIYDGANNYTHDVYYQFSASYEQELGESLTGGLQVVLGWFDESNVDSSDDSDIYVQGTASLSYAVSDNITVTPHASVKFSDNLGDQFFGGVNVGFSF